jgi:hypothetical protein
MYVSVSVIPEQCVKDKYFCVVPEVLHIIQSAQVSGAKLTFFDSLPHSLTILGNQ